MLRVTSKALVVFAAVVGVAWIGVLVASLNGTSVAPDIVIGIAAVGLLALVVAWELADRDDRRRRLAAIERSEEIYRPLGSRPDDRS